MKREAVQAQKEKGKFVCPDDMILQKLPRLAEACADLFWDDGTPREPYTLSFNWSTGQCLVQLNDKEVGRSLACTAPNAAEGLKMLNDLLGLPSLPWRYWGNKGKKTR